MNTHNIFSALSNVDGITWQEKLNTLNRCYCCKRHQINKPSNLITWVDTPFNCNQYTNCYCNCRHLARHICRQTGYYPGIGQPISKPPTPCSVIR